MNTNNINVKYDIKRILSNLDEMDTDKLNNELKFKFKTLSVRSYNAIFYYLEKDISITNYFESIINYKNFNFRNIRNVGSKSIIELELLHEQIISLIYEYDQFHSKNEIKDEIKNRPYFNLVSCLDNEEIFLLNKYLEVKIDRLTARSRNALNDYLNHEVSFKNYYENIINNEALRFCKLRNIGVKTIKELELLHSEIIFYLSDIKSKRNKREEYYSFLLEDLFNLSNDQKIELKGYLCENKIPIFKIIWYIIENTSLFNKTQKLVFKNIFLYKEDNHQLTLSGIGEITNLTRERVRQIRVKLLENISNLFEFVSYFNYNHINTYKINKNQNIIIINNSTAQEICKNELVNFSSLFYEIIFSILLRKTHKIIEIEYIKKAKFSHNYLIKSSLFFAFDYKSFLNDMFDGLNERVKNSYKINLKEFISCYYNEIYQTEFKEVYATVKEILQIEHNIIVDSNDYILIEKNTPILAHEYVLKILRYYKKPMHYTEIYDECIKRGYPAKSPLNVHANIQREPKIFGLKGPGTFGLIEWGEYYGSIGDVTEQILKERNKPIRLKDIVEIISNELIVSQDSIPNVLFNYKHEKRFLKLRSGKVALKEWYDINK